jgi:hypothetical protein
LRVKWRSVCAAVILSCSGHFALAKTPIVAAQHITAEQAMAHYREMTSIIAGHATSAKSCEGGTEADEIVVCGRVDGSKYRLPLPDERHQPGDRETLALGEVPRASLEGLPSYAFTRRK